MKKKSSWDERRIYQMLGQSGQNRNVSKIFFHCKRDLLHILRHNLKKKLLEQDKKNAKI